MDVLLQDAAQRKHGIGKIDIRERAVSYACPTIRNQRDVRVADEITMSKNRPPGQQTEFIERGSVRAAAAMQHELMFPITLGAMRLNMTAGLLRKPAEPAQQVIRAGWNKARCNDGTDRFGLIAWHRLHIRYEGTCFFLGALRGGISVVRGALLRIVHRDPADQRAL